MKILITSAIEDKADEAYFMYSYLPKYIKNQFLQHINRNRIELIDNQLHIDSYKILLAAVNNIQVRKIRKNIYQLSPDSNLLLGDKKLTQLLNLVTYGNLNSNGYKVLLDIFQSVSENIDMIYEVYHNGNSLL